METNSFFEFIPTQLMTEGMCLIATKKTIHDTGRQTRQRTAYYTIKDNLHDILNTGVIVSLKMLTKSIGYHSLIIILSKTYKDKDDRAILLQRLSSPPQTVSYLTTVYDALESGNYSAAIILTESIHGSEVSELVDLPSQFSNKFEVVDVDRLFKTKDSSKIKMTKSLSILTPKGKLTYPYDFSKILQYSIVARSMSDLLSISSKMRHMTVRTNNIRKRYKRSKPAARTTIPKILKCMRDYKVSRKEVKETVPMLEKQIEELRESIDQTTSELNKLIVKYNRDKPVYRMQMKIESDVTNMLSFTNNYCPMKLDTTNDDMPMVVAT